MSANIIVYVNGHGDRDLQKAISQFNKKVKDAEIIKELRIRREYMKPSVKKKWKREESKKKEIRERKRSQKFNNKNNKF